MKRASIALFTLLLLATSALAADQGRIVGTVVDAGGQPVADAKVVLTRNGTQVRQEKATSEKGQFSMLVLDASAEYTIHIEKDGFEPLDEAVQPKAGETLRVSYTLKAKSAQ
ncbi:MAG: carboxypeptidase regulatory-like domain-containing protein [Acidobacteria bacterium]|nr:carboxypeptidase regulatory-like domain-containing protein [Acidobacteriota bacterium]